MSELKPPTPETPAATLKPAATTPTTPAAPTNRPVLAWILSRLADQPRWVQILAVGLIAGVGAAIQFYRSAPADPVPVQAPAPVVNVTLPAPLPQPVEGAAEGAEANRGRLHVGHRLLGSRIRSQLSEQLQKDGGALIGKDPTPWSKEKADAAVKLLPDDAIAGGIEEYRGQQGDGPMVATGPIEWFKSIVAWLKAHPEVMKLFMALLFMLLGL